MSVQERVLVDLARLLDELHVPYMIIGGLANAVWGEPRATLDIDATLWVPPERLPAVVAELTQRLEAQVPDPLRFVEETRVLPLAGRHEVRIDAIFGVLPLEQEAIGRAVAIDVGDARVRFCTAEDLILLKVASRRERDLADVRRIVARRIEGLDLAYLDPRIDELALLLEQPEVRERWDEWKREARGGRE